MGGISLSSCFFFPPTPLPVLLRSCDPLPVVFFFFFKETAFAASIKESLNDPPADPPQREDGSSRIKRPPTHKVNNLTQFNLSPNVAGS